MVQYNIYMKCLQRLNAEVNTEHDYVVNDQQTTVCIIINYSFFILDVLPHKVIYNIIGRY